MKKATSAATATTGALGTSPPDVPEPAVCDESDRPNDHIELRAGRGDAAWALARFAVGCEVGRLVGLSRGCHATAVVVLGGTLDPAWRWDGHVRAGSGVRAAPGASVGEDSVGTMTTATSPPARAGGGSGRSGSAGNGTSRSMTTTTATSTSGTTGGAGVRGKNGSGGTSTVGAGTGSAAGGAAMTTGGGDTSAAPVPGCVAAPRSGGAPTAALHAQSHAQSHVQLSGVPLSICVENDAVWPQNVNVQVQDHRSFAGAAPLDALPPTASVEVVL